MEVQDIMNSIVHYARSDSSAAEVAEIMEKGRCGAVPIVNAENKLIGMVTDRDICLGLARKPRPAAQVAITELMSKSVYACSRTDRISTALRTMQIKKVRRLPVLDQRGSLVGILSIDDVVLHAEGSTARKVPELGYGQTIDTLKAIYRGRPAATA